MERMPDLGVDAFEGTSEEVAEYVSKFPGRRMRVQLLTVDAPVVPIALKPTGRYAARMRKILNELPPSTPEQKLRAEEELKELKRRLNENRRRDGAEILFPDV